MKLMKITIIIFILIMLNLSTSLLRGTNRLAEKGFDYFVSHTNYLTRHGDSVLYVSIIKGDSTYLNIRLPEKAGNKTVKVVLNSDEQKLVFQNLFQIYMERKVEWAFPVIAIHKNFLVYAKTEVLVFQINKSSEKPIGYFHDYVWLFWDWIEIGNHTIGY